MKPPIDYKAESMYLLKLRGKADDLGSVIYFGTPYAPGSKNNAF